MKRLGGMQPYFFPYIGYWQLINAVDCFVLFDESQYIRRGWVSRNRILGPDGNWHYITVPLQKHPVSTAIKDVPLAPDGVWRGRILNQLAQYRKTAPHYRDTHAFVEEMLHSGNENTLGALNCRIIADVCELLSIETELIVSSAHPFDYSEVRETGDWPLFQALQLGATDVINPVGGFGLLDVEKFTANDIGLSMIQVPQVRYGQPAEMLQPSLSIIDVLMYNGVAGTRHLLQECEITRISQAAAGASQAGG
ncbi:WbqC family protein [Castellaniella sp.]|uniref:WbqC family protein n=1 Tax=Castellaniella sp. TaxID=1955812 RepID=UPI00355DABE3